MSIKSIFTKERSVFAGIVAIIVALIGYFSASNTAKSQTEASLYDFKVEVAKELGAVKGDIQTNEAVAKTQYNEIIRSLENIDGKLQTLSSKLNK